MSATSTAELSVEVHVELKKNNPDIIQKDTAAVPKNFSLAWWGDPILSVICFSQQLTVPEVSQPRHSNSQLCKL